MNPVLTTPRLEMRLFTPAQAEILVELDSDPEVMRWISNGRAFTRDEVLAHSMPRIVQRTDASRGIGFWITRLRDSDDPIGWFHITVSYHWPGELEMGYRLFRRHWGKGFATEGGLGILDHGFNTLAARKIIAHAMRPNYPSRRVLVKLG
ncbi:MAG TPA: GNAT family N-acetyltransferase, partial [Phycisphaerales bacterium]|nr:GNAT family N-acetyltransferase [Phycisphaerales bacterium]